MYKHWIPAMKSSSGATVLELVNERSAFNKMTVKVDLKAADWLIHSRNYETLRDLFHMEFACAPEGQQQQQAGKARYFLLLLRMFILFPYLIFL